MAATATMTAQHQKDDLRSGATQRKHKHNFLLTDSAGGGDVVFTPVIPIEHALNVEVLLKGVSGSAESISNFDIRVSGTAATTPSATAGDSVLNEFSPAVPVTVETATEEGMSTNGPLRGMVMWVGLTIGSARSIEIEVILTESMR